MTASEHMLFIISVHSRVSSTGTGAEQLFHKQENTQRAYILHLIQETATAHKLYRAFTVTSTFQIFCEGCTSI